MPSFKNFANGGIDEGLSKEPTSIRHKQVRDNSVGSRIEKVWATDFEKCESREDFEKYISKYGKYEFNKYISQAQAKIAFFDAEEKARIEKERATRRIRNNTVVSTPYYRGGGSTPKPHVLQTYMKALVWIIIIGGVGFYSYYQYKQNLNENTTDVVVIQPSNPQSSQDVQEQHDTHTHSEQTHKPENTVAEPEPEPQEICWDCNICGTTGRCQLCFGFGRCGVCGGGGMLYRSGELVDCSNCGGSGWCPACEGSGFCFACKGSGRCKLEE